jgi:hypothetical protein
VAPERVPRVRLAAVPDEAVFVVRGDELMPRLLAEDASRFRERFPDWGRFGVSAFLAVDEGEVDALCEVRLVQFATVAIFRRGDLEHAGVDVVPTFRTPHVTLCHPVLEELVRRLVACDHVLRTNPYHVEE